MQMWTYPYLYLPSLPKAGKKNQKPLGQEGKAHQHPQPRLNLLGLPGTWRTSKEKPSCSEWSVPGANVSF